MGAAGNSATAASTDNVDDEGEMGEAGSRGGHSISRSTPERYRQAKTAEAIGDWRSRRLGRSSSAGRFSVCEFVTAP